MFWELKILIQNITGITGPWIPWIPWMVIDFFGAWNVLEKHYFLSLLRKSWILFFLKVGQHRPRKIGEISGKCFFLFELKENLREVISTNLHKD